MAVKIANTFFFNFNMPNHASSIYTSESILARVYNCVYTGSNYLEIGLFG